MDTLEYRTIDKADWGAGLWQHEPDKRQWPDTATGLPCLTKRGPGGHWCGYVGVPKGHPWHGVAYNSEQVRPCTDDCDDGGGYHYGCSPETTISVHGGLTYSDACERGAEETAICHKPSEGEPDDVWWFGFDCAHGGDFCPKYGDRFRVGEESYKDLAYVEVECAELAAQLARIAKL